MQENKNPTPLICEVGASLYPYSTIFPDTNPLIGVSQKRLPLVKLFTTLISRPLYISLHLQFVAENN